MSKKIKWASDPEAKDYAGVENFLTLLCSETEAKTVIDRLKKAAPAERAAKDILRAAALPLLGKDDAQVKEDLKTIQKGKALAPVLLVRGNLKDAQRLVVADGYHRICASYFVDEGALVACRLVDR